MTIGEERDRETGEGRVLDVEGEAEEGDGTRVTLSSGLVHPSATRRLFILVQIT